MKKFLELLIKVVVGSGLFFLFSILISVISPLRAQSLIVNTLLVIWVMSILWFMNQKEMQSFKKKKVQEEPNIFVWTNNLSGEFDLFSYIFGKRMSSISIIDNLQLIEARIFHLVEGNIKKVKLLRVYIKTLTQEKLEKVYFNAVVAGIITILSTLFSHNQNSLAALIGIKGISNINLFWGLIISLVYCALYFVLLPHRHDNRRNLALNLIEEIIEDMEKKRVN